MMGRIVEGNKMQKKFIKLSMSDNTIPNNYDLNCVCLYQRK